MKDPLKTYMRFVTWAMFTIASTFTILLLGCPPGTKSSVDLTVQVDPEHCKEDKDVTTTPGDLALLDCTTVGGTVHVQFPRKEWYAMRFGVPDAGPGK